MKILGRKVKSFKTPDGYNVIVYRKNGDCRKIHDPNYKCQDNCNKIFLYLECSQSEEGATIQPVSYLLPPFKYVQKEMEMLGAKSPEELEELCKNFEDLKSDLEIVKEKGKTTYRSKRENEITGMKGECGMSFKGEFEKCENSLPKEYLNEVNETIYHIEENINSLKKHAKPMGFRR